MGNEDVSSWGSALLNGSDYVFCYRSRGCLGEEEKGMALIFDSATLQGGRNTYGYEEDWHWSNNNSRDKKNPVMFDYNRGHDFFMIHWEINGKYPNIIKLHVESPRAGVDEVLSDIKRQMVQAFLTHDFDVIAESSNVGYRAGKMVNSDHIRAHKSVEPFRMILPETQNLNSSDLEGRIRIVDHMAGQAVRDIIERFKPKINPHFSRY